MRVRAGAFGGTVFPGPEALVLLMVAVVASMLAAARAARIDVIQALRSE
jgi:ABC-type antimicrobial peptide transport system permease subunit